MPSAMPPLVVAAGLAGTVTGSAFAPGTAGAPGVAGAAGATGSADASGALAHRPSPSTISSAVKTRFASTGTGASIEGNLRLLVKSGALKLPVSILAHPSAPTASAKTKAHANPAETNFISKIPTFLS